MAKKWRYILGLLIPVGGLVYWFFFDTPADVPRFTISKETTRITGPVDAQGFIDYAAGLNEALAAGVDKHENAVVLLCQVYGPRPEKGRYDPEFYQRLGIEEPPEQGDYYIFWETYFDSNNELSFEERERLKEGYEQVAEKPWKPADQPHYAAWLKNVAGPLQVGEAATLRPKYFYPVVAARTKHGRASMYSSFVSHVQKNRSLGISFVMRAMLHLGEGRTEAAWQDVLACHRLGRQTARGAMMIENLVGIALEAIATEATLTFLEHAVLDDQTLRRCWNDWKTLPPRKWVYENVDLGERFMVLETLVMTHRYGPDFLETLSGKRKENDLERRPIRGVDLDTALVNINRVFDDLVAALKEKEIHLRKAKLRKIEAERQVLLAKVRAGGGSILSGVFGNPQERGERLGNILIALLTPSIDKVQSSEYRLEQTRRNLDTAFALAAHRLDHKAYPKTLGDLVPKYLPEASMDLFNDAPLTYQPRDNGYLLYSVGLNHVDEGGASDDDEPSGDDLVVRMPRPPRPKKKVDRE